jgi:S-adenosylmethionine:tRNA ribosyltransferase-isomerase
MVPAVTASEAAAEFATAAYHYTLPRELIATRPPAARAEARLLVMERKPSPGAPIEHVRFGDLGRYLAPGDCLVLNETRVLKARLFGRRADSGGQVELLLLGPATGPAGGEDAMAGVWDAIGRPGRRLLPGTRLELGEGTIAGEILAVEEGGRRRVRLEAREGTLTERLEAVGHVPIPPYLGRPDDERDALDYQTVYARVPGGIAAPTAGLHFTPELLRELEALGVTIAKIVLHPGPGTFRPVETADLRQHRLDAEPFVVPDATAAAIAATRERGGRVVAVGTTVVRTLEARAIAARAAGDPQPILPGSGRTDLFIYPPFTFQVVDALITNFHLPQSTLLMLVAAFAGRERVLTAYEHAVAERYLFYSYGDAMLIR